ncbi:MAG TPA: TRAP transporter fused permease subunit [Streptosporangiaceae bacterium]|nr:TRAP transporter fused permease subunit [Streptosporangiaceae bacterium]
MTVAAAPGADVAQDYEQERPARQLAGIPKGLVWAAAGLLSCYALLVVFRPVAVLQYRMTFLAVALPLTFLVYRSGFDLARLRRLRGLRGSRRSRGRRRSGEPGEGEGEPDREAATAESGGPAAPEVSAGPATSEGSIAPERRNAPERPAVADWLLAAVSVAVLVYPLLDFDAFVTRGTDPTGTDMVLGIALTVLVLEATRRTVGWVLPAICVAFLVYAYYGDYIPLGWEIGHRGFDVPSLVDHLYMGTEGFFGVPLDVAATYIVLFTIYGAVLDLSGASRFFIDISFAAFRRSRTAPGRTVTTAGFLLGTVSGSGVATTVSLGSVSWPILRRAGYPPEQAGGVMAAGGIGAILSPPTLGAAAFIIAELLRISYLKVLLYALVPTILYYVGVFLAIEIDARRLRTRAVPVDAPSLGRLLLRFGYHFSSLGLIVLLMAIGRSPFQAVVIATVVAFALSFLDRSHWLTPRRLWVALVQGTLGVLPVTAVCAAAGIIVGVVTLTGLGLKLSDIVVDLSGGHLALTALFAGVAIWVLGLAVPVTASFVIAAVIIAPALTGLGVAAPEAYMFVFYYAVLSEVSPPTALAAVAASAITGGDAFRTMMMTWRYTLPAFLVPFAFVLTDNGAALLGLKPWPDVLLATAVSIVAIAALAAVTGAWLLGPARWPERALCALAAVLLLYLEAAPVLAGLGALGAAVVVHLALRRSRSPQGEPRT